MSNTQEQLSHAPLGLSAVEKVHILIMHVCNGQTNGMLRSGLHEVCNLVKDTSARRPWTLLVHENGEHASLLEAFGGGDDGHDAYMSAVKHTPPT